MTLTKAKDDTTHTFLSIDKEEQSVLMAYFKQSNIKIKIENVDGQPGMDLSDDDEVPAKEDSREKDGKR